MSKLYEYQNINSVDLALVLAQRVKQRRLEKGLSREALTKLSGVPTPTIARFEQKKSISLKQFMDLVIALGYGDQLQGIMSEAQYSSLEELEQIRKNKNRQRGRDIVK